MGLFWALMALGEKATTGYYDSYATVFNLVNTRQLPDTLRHHPDTPRHHPDTSRHHPDTPTHRGFYASEVTGRTMQYLSVMTIYDFYWIASIPDSIQSHPNALQAPSRHPPDTSQTPQNLALFGCGRKGNSLIWQLLFNRLWSMICYCYILISWHPGINTTPDTLRHHPDTTRHHPDTLRKRHFYVI